MAQIKFQYSYRKKNISIQGFVNDRTLEYIKLLDRLFQRFYLKDVINKVANLFNYENQQMGSILIIFFTTIITQIISHFFFNTQINHGYSHLLLTALIIFTLIFHILMSKKVKIHLLVVLQIVFSTGLALVYYYQYQDYYFFSYFFSLNSIILTLSILKIYLQQQLKQKLFTVFQFQSSIFILCYLVCKSQQFLIPYIQSSVSLNAFNLIPTFIWLLIVNTLKIWQLFDYNPIYLFHLINTSHLNQVAQYQKKQYIEQLMNQYDKNQPLEGNNNKNLKQDLIEENDNSAINLKVDQNNLNHEVSKKQFEDYILQEKSDKSEEQRQNNQKIQQENPYTSLIIIAFTFNFIYCTMMIIFSFYSFYSDAEIYLMSFGVFKLLIIILYCQFQSIMLSQNQKNRFYHLIKSITDILILSPLILLLFYEEQISLLNIYKRISIISNSCIPTTTVIIFPQILKNISIRYHNRSIVHFFIFWIALFSIRETFAFLTSDFSKLEYLIDFCLLVYFLFIIFGYKKLATYKRLYQTLKMILKIKKPKLFIMQSLKNWNYDSSNISQILFHLNFQTFFLAYISMRLFSKAFNSFKVEYIIILNSSFFIHLIQRFFDNFTQKERSKSKKISNSFYLISIILISFALVYYLISHFILKSDRHQKNSIIIIALMIFIGLVNIINLYIFQTFRDYRNCTRTICAILSYLLFYYPFITIFTIQFYFSDLDKEFIFHYLIGGFIYITITSTLAGTMVHTILNLTQKSKRSLYIMNCVSQQLRKINMKQDLDVISMIQNLYDLMDGNTDKLYKQLLNQIHYKIVIHDNQNIQQDYSFVQCQKNKQNQINKLLLNNLANQILKIGNRRKRLNQTKQNFKDKIVQKKLKKFNVYEYKQDQPQLYLNDNLSTSQIINCINQNITEVKRLYTIKHSNNTSLMKILALRNKITFQKQFLQIVQNQKDIRMAMHKFFDFLSFPSKIIKNQTGMYLDMLLSNSKLKEQDKFKNFSMDIMDQEIFRDFIVNYMVKSYDMQIQSTDPHEIWQLFIKNQLFVLIHYGNQYFKYYMFRRQIQCKPQQDQIWKSTKNTKKIQQFLNFKKQYAKKKQKALGKRKNNQLSDKTLRDKLILQATNIVQNQTTISQTPKYDQNNFQIRKKHKLFLTTDVIYSMIVKTFVQSINNYEKIEHQTYKLTSFKFTLSNIIALLTKIYDFAYIYTYGCIYTLYSYGIKDFSNDKNFLSFLDYEYLIGFALIGVLIYFGLIIFHKKDFRTGNLGLDQNKKVLSFTNLKYYSTFMLFLMGSSFSNIFIMASINSYLCDQTTQKLFNFPLNDCYTKTHMVQMFISLLILVSYYPLALLIFPFSTAIDKTLEIKYKSEYQVLYLQSKLLMNGVNVIFNQFDFRTEELIKRMVTTIICIILAVFFRKLQPCSVEYINSIQFKIYIFLIIINISGILCYFIGLYATVITVSVLLFIYILVTFLTTVKIMDNFYINNQDQANQLIQEKIKKQEILKMRLRKNQGKEQIETPPVFTLLVKNVWNQAIPQNKIQIDDEQLIKRIQTRNVTKSIHQREYEQKVTVQKTRRPSLSVTIDKNSSRKDRKSLIITQELNNQIQLIPATNKSRKQVVHQKRASKFRDFNNH